MNAQDPDNDTIVSTLSAAWGLDQQKIQAFRDRFHLLALASGETLFDQGEPSDCVYLLITGRLAAFGATSEHAERVTNGSQESGPAERVGDVVAGETVGELGVITETPRSATVKAVRYSELARVERETFLEIVASDPDIMLRFTKMMATRMSLMLGGTPKRKPPTTQAIVSLDSTFNLSQLSTHLCRCCEAHGSVRTLDDTCADFTSSQLFQEETVHDRLLYLAQNPLDRWAQICMRQSDVVHFVATPETAALPEDALKLIQGIGKDRERQLILIRNGPADQSKAPTWLNELPFSVRWNIDLNNAASLARLDRIVTRRTVGLVLSGGGSRGFAHLGVIKAMREAGVDIDHIGGTSMGGLIAAGSATSWSVEEFHEKLRQSFLHRNPIGDYTLPMHAFARGRRLSMLLENSFGDLAIEDLEIPFYCTSTNLSRGGANIHDKGAVWRAVRASVSIPALVPPIVENNEVLVDGGLVNNLPIKTMRLRNAGPVLASDVGDQREAFTVDENLVAGGVWSMLNNRSSPTAPNILIRSMTVAGERETQAQQKLADIVVRPPVAGLGLLNWRQLDRIVDIGYQFAIEEDIPGTFQRLIDERNRLN